MKQCMHNRIRHSVRNLSRVNQLSQIGAYNMKFTPKFLGSTCNRVQHQVYAVVAYIVKSTTKFLLFVFIFFQSYMLFTSRGLLGKPLYPQLSGPCNRPCLRVSRVFTRRSPQTEVDKPCVNTGYQTKSHKTTHTMQS